MVNLKMQGDEVLKDALEKVSGRLRKAVGLNRHELGGLHNVVSQMKKERNRSVGILSKQQQDFIQKQAKLLPALSMTVAKRSRKTSNQVIPLDVRRPLNNEHKTLTRSSSKGISSNHFSVLPPIQRPSRVSQGPNSHEAGAKQQRISNYNKEFSSLQESLNNAYKFANSHKTDSPTDKAAGKNDACSINKNNDVTYAGHAVGLRPLQNFEEEEERSSVVKTSPRGPGVSRGETESGSRHIGNDNVKYFDANSLSEIDTRIASQRLKAREKTEELDAVDLVAVENAPTYNTDNGSVYQNNAASRHWKTVRDRLRSISMMNQKQHERYLDRLYEEIRQCRYIRKPKRKKGDSSGYGSSEEDTF